MARTWLMAGTLVLVAGAAAAQQADIRNAQVETRATPIDRTVAALSGATDPIWIGWRVPMVTGPRELCGVWSDGTTTVRGAVLEERAGVPAPAATDAPVSVANLEAGTTLIVWLRVVDGRIERLRTVTDDCPVDGGGRQLIWLSSVSAVDSLRFLDTLLAPPALPADTHRRLATSALTAIALHADPAADAVLDRFLTPVADPALRNVAATWMARARGARGLTRLTDIVRAANDAALRRTATAAIAQTRQPDTLATLWRIAETDADEYVRAEAMGGYAELAPETEMTRVTARLAGEASDTVKQRAIRGLARRPAEASVPLLVTLARTSADKTVRLEAARVLSRSNHPAAIAYLAEVLR